MSNKTAGFYRKDKITGSSVMPVIESRFRGQPVEGIVEFYRGEMPGVELQPGGLFNFPGVEKPAPVIVVPARRADKVGSQIRCLRFYSSTGIPLFQSGRFDRAGAIGYIRKGP